MWLDNTNQALCTFIFKKNSIHRLVGLVSWHTFMGGLNTGTVETTIHWYLSCFTFNITKIASYSIVCIHAHLPYWLYSSNTHLPPLHLSKTCLSHISGSEAHCVGSLPTWHINVSASLCNGWSGGGSSLPDQAKITCWHFNKVTWSQLSAYNTTLCEANFCSHAV